MADIKVYRAGYLLDGDRVYFSDWVTEDGMEEMLVQIAEQPILVEGLPGSGGWVEPTVLGWEEKKLKPEPD